MTPAGSREPVSHSLPAVLLEVVLRVPALVETDADPARQQAAAGIAAIVEEFARAVRASQGRFLGVADLTLLACWPSSEIGVAAAAARALDQLDALASRLDAHAPEHELRAAVLAGTAVLGSVGGLAGRWTSIASGAVAEQLGAAMGACEPGRIVLSAAIPLSDAQAAHALPLPGGLQGLPLGLGSAAPGATSPELGSVAVTLSPCSVVAVSIHGADRHRSDYLGRLHGAFRALQRAARLHDGVLGELRHDHRGLFALVLFDAARGRARRAALGALRFGDEAGRILGEQGLDAPAAVASASAWTWPLESCWGTVGTAVDRAVHLSRGISSELVCDEATAQLAQGRIRVEVLPPKGDEPCYGVEHVDASRAKRWTVASGVVGRREELSRLDQVVGEFMAGTTSVLMVEGELGLGKSRLVDELVARLRAESCRVVVGYGVPGAAAAPLTPWRSILLQLLGLQAPVDPAVCEEALHEQLDPEEREAALALLAGLLPLGRTPDPTLAGAGLLHELVVPLVHRLRAGQPLLVVLEDGQWLDSASWALARQLATGLEDLLLVVSLRTDHPEQAVEVQRLAALPETSVMMLRGLGAGDLAELVQRELGIRGLSDDLLQWLRASTRGNPLLCLEWIRLLQDEGELRIEDGLVTHAPDAADLVQRRVADLPSLLQRRVSMLPPQVLRTLAICTQAGGVFETELVAEVHADHPGRHRVVADLEHLATAGLVQPAPGRVERAYSVTHPAVVEAARGGLSPDEHRVLHAAIASWYEQRQDDLAPLYPLLAQHWIEAGGVPSALRYLELAGGQAMRSGAMPEAVRHFQQALRLAAGEAERNDPREALRRAHWERCLGDARYACGELDRCSVHYDRALQLVGHRVPRGRVRLALYAAWQLGRQLLHRLLPEQAIAVDPERHARLLEASHAAERLAERYYYSADALSLCSSSVLSANLADLTGLQGRNARPYASMSYLIGLLGLEGLSGRVYQRALDIGEQAPDPAGLAVTLYTRATLHAGRGAWAQALALADRAIVTAGAAAAWQEQGVAHTMKGVCLFMQGEFGPAESAYGELLGVARERYNAQHEAWALYGVGQCQLRIGRLHEASRSVRQALAVLRNLDDYPSRLICHGLLASIHLRQGRPDRAREAADQAWAQVKRVRVPFVLPTVEGIDGMAEAYLELWAQERAAGAAMSGLEARATAAVRTLGMFARIFPVGRPRHQLALGRLCSIRGRHARARAAYARALSGAEALGMPLEAATARASLALQPGCDPARAVELRAAAQAGFQSLGCAWHLEELEGQQGQSQ